MIIKKKVENFIYKFRSYLKSNVVKIWKDKVKQTEAAAEKSTCARKFQEVFGLDNLNVEEAIDNEAANVQDEVSVEDIFREERKAEKEIEVRLERLKVFNSI